MLPEMFVGAFQNGLKSGNFKESLVQKSIASMEEIAARAKMQNVTSREKKETLKKEFGIQERERGGGKSEASGQRRNQNSIQVWEKIVFKPTRMPLEHFTP